MRFGTTLPRGTWFPLRDGIGEIETSQAGNVCIRVGTELPPQGKETTPSAWTQTAYVVLTPTEARAFAAALVEAAGS